MPIKLHIEKKLRCDTGHAVKSHTVGDSAPQCGAGLCKALFPGSENHDWRPAVSYFLVHLYLSDDTIRPFKHKTLGAPDLQSRVEGNVPKQAFTAPPDSPLSLWLSLESHILQ